MINRSSATASLSNLFVGDALSMPVHWFYNPGDIIRQFGVMGVQEMHAAPDIHPSSIMVLHSTKAGGRRAVEKHADRAASQHVVGDVILKGKREFWGQAGKHYHHGMSSGENTLNAWWARELMQYLIDEDSYNLNTWADRYIEFMTADPAKHPDTYAESCHRGFFANWVSGKDPLNCGAVTHDTPSMGALVTLAPLVIALKRDNSSGKVKELCRHHIGLTHPDDSLMNVVDTYVELILTLFNQPSDSDGVLDLEESYAAKDNHSVIAHYQKAMNVTGRVDIEQLMRNARGDAAIVGGRYSLACYISDSWPSVCYLAAKYRSDPAKAMIVNTNLGGENAHRGAVLGTLVGAASGQVAKGLFKQLAHNEDLDQLVDRFLSQFIA